MNKVVNLKNLTTDVVMKALREVYLDWNFTELQNSQNFEVVPKDEAEKGKLTLKFYKQDENTFVDISVIEGEETDWTKKSVERLLEYIA